MSGTEPKQTIDLTGAPADKLEFIEVLTDGGIIRINTGQVDTATGEPVIVVEITQNTPWNPQTAPGGEWDVRVRKLGLGQRTDIAIVRR
jgi:hypothetical protein